MRGYYQDAVICSNKEFGKMYGTCKRETRFIKVFLPGQNEGETGPALRGLKGAPA